MNVTRAPTLRGKRVRLGNPQSGLALTALRIFEHLLRDLVV
jgi:TRAP-type uncharacterized transport system substrate-binding protein